jgi:hypothetical protein
MYLKQNPDKDRACYSHFTTATGLHLFFNEFFRKTIAEAAILLKLKKKNIH